MIGLVVTRKEPRLDLRDGGGIRCPKCSWEPAKGDRWCCEPGCGHVWNTFETRGCCPGCSTQWTQTVCLRCLQWSEHEAWYVDG